LHEEDKNKAITNEAFMNEYVFIYCLKSSSHINLPLMPPLLLLLLQLVVLFRFSAIWFGV
jgi:hypothetical protein